MTKEAKNRKETPIKSGVLDYFPDAIRAVAQCSFVGNEQHNPGSELHWDRSKSGDELDALTRHLMDAGTLDSDGIRHSAKVAWRALANLQKEIEREKELDLEDWQEEIIAKSKEEDFMYGPCSMHAFEDNDECDGELGSHPLCCTDYCPCKEEEIERRMNIIGQNGNSGEHYESVGVAVPTERVCGWDNTKKNINSPDNVTSTLRIKDASVTVEYNGV